jgi:hypothetical protein
MDSMRVASAVGYFIRLLEAMKRGVVGERQLCERFPGDMGIHVEIRGGYYVWPGAGKGIHGSAGGEMRKAADRYTKAEIAQGLGLSIPTIDDWVRKGLLTPYRVTHKAVFYSWEEELALLQKGTRRSGGSVDRGEVGQNPGRKPPIEQR